MAKALARLGEGFLKGGVFFSGAILLTLFDSNVWIALRPGSVRRLRRLRRRGGVALPRARRDLGAAQRAAGRCCTMFAAGHYVL